jgi:Flp pilus assembly pilin Flp
MVERPEKLHEIRTEKGQALVEYTLILMLVALVCVATITGLGTFVAGLIGAMAAAF